MKKFFSLLISFILVSCSTTPISGEKAFLVTSESEERAMGKEAYREIKSKERLTQNKKIAGIVNQVGLNIAKHANKPEYEWEINTFENSTPNAFCLPGGKIGIYTGILKYAKNEAGLATVMGHEVAHAIARHGGQRMSQQLVTNLGMAALSVAVFTDMEKNKKNLLMAALGVGVTVGVMLPYSRKHELEADEIGMILMARAGYDPRESVRFWQRFAEAGGKKPPEFLSTHPHSDNRAERLQNMMPRAMEIYQKAPVKHGLGKNL